MGTEPWELGVRALQSAFAARTLTPDEVVAACLTRIEALDGAVGAFRQVAAERATSEAAERTAQLGRGETQGPLHGIPVAIKELFDVEGLSGCYGSEVFADRISPSDAEIVRRLRAVGAVVMGVTRSHELGWGITTQHATLGSTGNPWALDRVPGGSSGGSAAALATGMVPVAVGSDTGGSIRIPAGFCGAAGIKPTYGRIPKRGGVALAPSLDHPGVMARSVPDLADGYLAMAGHDPLDPSTFAVPAPHVGDLAEGAHGMRVGLAPDLHLRPLRDDYAELFERVVRVLEGAGAELVEVPIAGADRIRAAFGAIQMAEALHYHSTILGTYPERAGQYGGDVRGRLQMATEVTISDYLDARTTAQLVGRAFEEAFARVDVILTPVSAGGPSSVSDPDEVSHRGSSLPFRDLVMDYTVPQDLIGLPAVVVRSGYDHDGIPVGVQLTARRYDEATALRAGAGLEAALGLAFPWPAVELAV